MGTTGETGTNQSKVVILTDKFRNEGPDVLIVPVLVSAAGAENDWDVKPEILRAAQALIPTVSLNQIMMSRPRQEDDAPEEVAPSDIYKWYAEWRLMKGF